MKRQIGDIIREYRSQYEKLRPVYSPAIGEEVFFNIQGFKHLIYKGKHRRTNAAIHNRLVLIPLIPAVIKNCDEEVEMRVKREFVDGKKVKVTYYALEANVGKANARVRVVTRKLGTNGKHYFLSVMKY